jgi:hypothetical protein
LAAAAKNPVRGGYTGKPPLYFCAGFSQSPLRFCASFFAIETKKLIGVCHIPLLQGMLGFRLTHTLISFLVEDFVDNLSIAQRKRAGKITYPQPLWFYFLAST